MNNIYVYLGIYILILFGISYYVSRRQKSEDFLISGRDRKGWQIFLSKFGAAMGVGWFITYTGFSYEYGLGVFAMLLGLLVGFPLFGYWAAPKVHKHSKKKKFYTIGDYVYSRTKSIFAMRVADVLSSAIIFSWLLVAIIGGSKIIADFGFLSYPVAVIVTSLVVLVYLLLAGFKAVIITDIFQSIIIAVLLVVITFGIVGTKNLSTLFSVETGGVNIGVVIGFLLYGIFSVFSFSDRYQLCYAAKDEKSVKHGLGLAILPIVIAAGFLLLIGLFMAMNSPGLDSGLVFTEALKNFLPAALLPLGIVLFLAGVMSSADTNIYSIASHFALTRKRKDPIKTIRKLTIWLVVITAIIAIIFSDIVDVSIFAGGISLTISLAMVYILSNGKYTSRFISSIIGGFVGLFVGLGIFGADPTIALTTMVGGAVGLLFKFEKSVKKSK